MIRRFENVTQNAKFFDYKRFTRKEREQMWINKIEISDFILDLVLFLPDYKNLSIFYSSFLSSRIWALELWKELKPKVKVMIFYYLQEIMFREDASKAWVKPNVWQIPMLICNLNHLSSVLKDKITSTFSEHMIHSYMHITQLLL